MKKRETISVIIPVYRVENYLNQCIGSVQQQTYEDLEIILVDDGSPDRCGEICEEYRHKDPRIHVIHQANGGLSAARNAGMAAATGVYLYFLDSDDGIPPQALADLYHALQRYEAGMALGLYVRVPEGIKPEDAVNASAAVFSDSVNCDEGITALKYLYQDPWKGAAAMACGKLYRRELWEGIQFPLGKCHEDEFVAHYLLDRAKRVVFLAQPLYYYLIRQDSITEQKYQTRRLDLGEALQDRIRFFEKKGYRDLADKAGVQYLWWLVDSYSKVYRYLPQEKLILQHLIDQFILQYRKQRFSSQLERWKYTLFLLYPKGVAVIKTRTNQKSR